MLVPLYDIFGDNLVKQVGVNSGSYKFTSVKGMPYIEIDDKELSITLDVASQIAERLEKNKRRVIPLSGNDKKPVEKVLKCFRFSPSDSISTVLKKFDLNSGPCEIDSLPSFIKPEFYEYGRVPGKPGGEKSKMRVDGRYVILAIAGWLLSRVGTAKMGNEWVGVHVFTTTKSLLYNAYGDFAGVKPETAFIILLAKRVIESNSNISSARVYLVSDAGGQNPTVILGGFTVDLSRFLEKKELINDDLIYLAEDALKSDNENQGFNTKDFSTRVVNLVYEIINGSKKVEELLYFTNREVSMEVVSGKFKEFCKDYKAYCKAYYYSQKLIRDLA